MNLALMLLSCTGSPRITDYDRPWVELLVAHVADYFRDQSGGREQVAFRVLDWFELPPLLCGPAAGWTCPKTASTSPSR
jgi:hypothetical protein